MRKVRPEDEIPSVDLSFSAVKKREDHFKGRQLSNQLAKKLGAIQTYLVKTSKQPDAIVDVEALVTRVYKLADQVIAEAVGDNHVCRKGCAYCCKVPVQVTAIEMSYLVAHYGVVVQHLKEKTSLVTVDTYCPMLNQEDATCTVWNERPLACRSFHSIDSYVPCAEDEAHTLFAMRASQALTMLQDILIQLSESSNYAAYADIRQWVKD